MKVIVTALMFCCICCNIHLAFMLESFTSATPVAVPDAEAGLESGLVKLVPIGPGMSVFVGAAQPF